VDGHYGVAAAVDGGFDETHCCFLSALLILVVWFVGGLGYSGLLLVLDCVGGGSFPRSLGP
jgi:hypothetical protein